MAEPTTPFSLTDTAVTVHTAALPGEDAVLMFIEANAHVTHVVSLTPDAARQLIVGLFDAMDVTALTGDDIAPER